MIVFYKNTVRRQPQPNLKPTLKISRRFQRCKKLTNNNKSFLRALGFTI